ncbi:alpha/beta hydrolase-fold protein [Streptomyces sp. 4F14]|uniref:alpha/beta hydrolase-fold protein n=1 Tax=Streptomyces sp. 4F14 TaxID=3394380 RepID=UPI003A89AAF5
MADNAFTEYGLHGEVGTDAFWTAVTGPTSVPDEGGWRTLFLWRGDERGDGARIGFESWSEPVALTRWAGTDCWYAEVAMPERLRVTYQFLVGDEAHADPFNPFGAGGDRSIAATPDAPAQPYWPAVGADAVLPVPRARVRWASERLGGRRTVRLHPVGGGGPLVLLLDGDDWLYLHPATTAFDAAHAAGELPPVTLAFLPAKDREAEYTCRRELWEAVDDELLPLIAESGVPADASRLVAVGQSLGGLSALYGALEFPELVSGVACQSGSFWWTPEAIGSADPLGGVVGGSMADLVREAGRLDGLRVAFDVGEHERAMLPHCGLVEELVEGAGAEVRVSRAAADHDRAGWRGALVRDVGWVLR